MITRKIIQIGSSAGIIFPKTLLDAKNLNIGDTLTVRETSSGILIELPDDGSQRTKKITELALNFVDRYRDDLQALADK